MQYYNPNDCHIQICCHTCANLIFGTFISEKPTHCAATGVLLAPGCVGELQPCDDWRPKVKERYTVSITNRI
jgi:hypothetical protein